MEDYRKERRQSKKCVCLCNVWNGESKCLPDSGRYPEPERCSIYDKSVNENGDEIRVLNKKETMLASQKQDAMKAAFKDWIFKDQQRRERLVKVYNERFNSIRPREYDGSHLSFQE